MSVEIAPRPEAPITHGEIETIFRLARGLSLSGFFKDSRQAEQAFAKLIFGRDLGLSATQAMTDIHIVEGKPEMSANLQAAKVRASDYDYRVLAHDASRCVIEFGPAPAPGRGNDGAWLPWPVAFGESEFTIEDARTADLAQKGVWRKYARNMLFARAMSNGVAWYCPDVFNGVRVYAEGEVHDAVTAESEQPQTPQPSAAPDTAMVDALAKGVNLAGWDDARLSMELVDLGVDDVANPTGALATLTPEQGAELNRRLSDALDAAEQDPATGEGADDVDA